MLLNQTLHIVRATPKIFSLFQTAINFFNAKSNVPCNHIAKITSVTLSDRRNTRLSFVRNNRFRVGLNSIHNRLRSISNVLDKNWTDESAANFKLNCKIRIIQNSLVSLQKSIKHRSFSFNNMLCKPIIQDSKKSITYFIKCCS